MIEVIPNLFVGNQQDYDFRVSGQAGWAVVHACKEPYHRQALGYTGRSAPKSHPEYLLARRADRLMLNLVDVDDPRYFAKEIMDAALAFIDDALKAGKKVLVHCNQGESRSPSIALLYLASKGTLPKSSLVEAEQAFRRIYPAYNPRTGVRGFLEQHWASYVNAS